MRATGRSSSVRSALRLAGGSAYKSHCALFGVSSSTLRIEAAVGGASAGQWQGVSGASVGRQPGGSGTAAGRQ